VIPLWSVDVALVVLSCDPSSNGSLVVDMTICDRLTMSECAEPVPFATGVWAFSSCWRSPRRPILQISHTVCFRYYACVQLQARGRWRKHLAMEITIGAKRQEL
jgi:hypothetical protein